MTLPWVQRFMSDALEQSILGVAQERWIYGEPLQAKHHNINTRLRVTSHQMKKSVTITGLRCQVLIDERLVLHSSDKPLTLPFRDWLL
jgi:hypothetical protein